MNHRDSACQQGMRVPEVPQGAGDDQATNMHCGYCS